MTPARLIGRTRRKDTLKIPSFYPVQVIACEETLPHIAAGPSRAPHWGERGDGLPLSCTFLLAPMLKMSSSNPLAGRQAGKLLSFLVLFCVPPAGLQAQAREEVSLGADRTQQVYYSLQTGHVRETSLDDWELAFSLNQRSATVRCNHVRVTLYSLPEGTSLSSDASEWALLNDRTASWYTSAFSSDAGRHPDYGWGRYDGATVLGHDRLYVLEWPGETRRALRIDRLEGNTYHFYVGAASDGGTVPAPNTAVSLNKLDYPGKNFAYYSFGDGVVKDLEPPADSWGFSVHPI